MTDKETMKEESILINSEPEKRPLNLKLLTNLLKYSDRYEISIQFWPDQTAVFIEKDGVSLESWGAGSKNFAIKEALKYLHRINKNNEKAD